MNEGVDEASYDEEAGAVIVALEETEGRHYRRGRALGGEEFYQFGVREGLRRLRCGDADGEASLM